MIKHFDFKETNLKGAFLIQPFVADDLRGSFIKDYSEEVFQKHGIHHVLKEVFYTYSKKGVIRAIHFQKVKEQAKLVRCISGKIFDVIVDLRKDSATFGKWQSFILSEENQHELYIPKHFGHGYLVLEPSIVSYQCDEKFYGEFDDGIIWNDPNLKIDWPTHLVESIILSEKDQNLQTFEVFKKQ
jgi:dTDP-4-dehydrorhamnose 3,5-epimerase